MGFPDMARHSAGLAVIHTSSAGPTLTVFLTSRRVMGFPDMDGFFVLMDAATLFHLPGF
jgi:hypothetical protein